MAILTIFDNDILHVAAETLLIVTGSMLLGILVGYVYYAKVKGELTGSRQDVARLRKEADELRGQLQDALVLQRASESELDEARAKIELQSRTIHDHYGAMLSEEHKQARHQAELDDLRAQIEAYRARLQVIEAELTLARATRPTVDATAVPGPPASVSYAHVSDIMGKAVADNDLTVISGIGPKTSSLLHVHGVRTWQELADTSVDLLRHILEGEGGVYRAIDPTHWPEQALMASRGEWRKLRAFQEYLRQPGKA